MSKLVSAVERKTIDQTASEKELHRVLFVIKLLRAMILHLLLVTLAALLSLLFGINGVYPVGNAFIHALRAQAIQSRLEYGWGGRLGFIIGISAVLISCLALLIWIYTSITNVRRSALRFQAIVFVVTGLCNLYTAWPGLDFAFRHLSLLFAALASLGVAMTMIIMPTSVALALWGVARVPERFSLVATLDPRLAPNRWIYLNKLLDLPRTPLSTRRTTAAYVLAFAGALLMIASMMYLITVGGVFNTLTVLALAGKHDLMEQSVAISSTEGPKIVILLLSAVAGVKLAAFLQSTAKKLGGLSASDVISHSDDRFLLYLRAFDLDNVILPKPRLPIMSRLFSLHPYPVRIEEELFDVADGYRPLIAVAKPGESTAMPGGVAYRAHLEDSKWQEYVAESIQRAERIVIVLKDTDGVKWELSRIIDEGAVRKTLFFVHPEFRHSNYSEKLESMVRLVLEKAGVSAEDFAAERRPIAFFFQNGAMIEIVNSNWSATSYRTAFSHFLAESRGATCLPEGKAAAVMG